MQATYPVQTVKICLQKAESSKSDNYDGILHCIRVLFCHCVPGLLIICLMLRSLLRAPRACLDSTRQAAKARLMF